VENAKRAFMNWGIFKVLRSQSGQTLIYALAASMLLVVLSGLSLNFVQTRLKQAQTQTKSGTRNAIITSINNITKSPAIVLNSLYDSSCLNEKVDNDVNNPNFDTSVFPCLNKMGQVLPDGFRELPLKSPVDNSLLTGTAAAPVKYSIFGEICSDSSEFCPFEVTTAYRFANYIENGESKESVSLRYTVRDQRNNQTTNSTVVHNGLLVLGEIQGEAVLPLERVNFRGDPAKMEACTKSDGSLDTSKRGFFIGAVKKNTSWLNNEEPSCIPAMGARVCKDREFLVGFTSGGSPICKGSKAKCDPGFVQMGYKHGSGPEPYCISANCISRLSPSDSSLRFGVLRPTTADNLDLAGHGCVLFKPTSDCSTRVKSGINHKGDMNCSKRTNSGVGPVAGTFLGSIGPSK
jgi:hypothetical protein